MVDADTAAHTECGGGSHLHEIVVVGGGAGGLELATRLGERFGKPGRARITLVEKARAHVWKPLLHSIAAGSLDRAQHELDYLAQAHWHGFAYHFGPMIGLDRAARSVLLGATEDEEGRQITAPAAISYDTLVIAVGSVTNDFGTLGAAQFAVPLDTPDQASRFHRRLLNACLRANQQADPVRPGQLHIAIIGAGATGTELAAELHRTVRALVAYGLNRIDPERDIHIVLLDAAERILPALPERISEAAADLLRRLGVEIRTRARVREVRADGVVLADGAFVPAELVVWSAGVKAPDFLGGLDGLEANRLNQLVVLPTLQTPGDPDIFAIGDCAAVPRDGYSAPVPPRAQAAHQEAAHMVRQIRSRLQQGQLRPFTYRDFGSLVSLGTYSTIGTLMGLLGGRNMFVEGYVALLMYRSLYLMHQSALLGRRAALWGAILRGLVEGPKPEVKLH
ncbi:MAG: NAD(P)/FAD-dependent oxidoreductase [Acetobacteraceae bacterium]|nr:NAD(P)/FAD-dependent oxidoreductase [Acetobacteraceae bacterium]